MRKKGVWGICLLVVLLQACTVEKKPKKAVITVRKTIIHPLFFQEEIAAQLNFPFWFNDSIIRAQNVQTIIWTVFRSTQLDVDTKDVEQNEKTKIRYTFDLNGRLIAIERNDYSEGLIISTKNYAIVATASPLYDHAKRLHPAMNQEGQHVEPYAFLHPVGTNKRVLQYDDEYTDTRYHFFPDKKFWGPLSIDSIAHPGSNDWIICGTPEKPEKRYQVRNTVTERNVSHYTYLNHNYPAMISWSDYPFTQRRYFIYSKTGIFTGFIDSTFIDQSFVTSNRSVFQLDGLNRPKQITHQKGHGTAEKNYQTIETITYTSFPSH